MSNLLPSQGTKFLKDSEIKKEWILVDAREQTLGRLASRIAHHLRGKHRPDFAPHIDQGDHVIVVNARQIQVSGRKMEQKKYYQHSHYPGGLRTFTLREKMERDPIYAVKKAVKRMLPSGPMGRKLYLHLHVYPDMEHSHSAQKPTIWNGKYR